MMFKTPDEIKRAMAYCVELYCPGEKCPYYNAESCAQDKTYDALALIQQLEAQNAEQAERIRQLEAERDAAVEDLQMGVCCGTCAYDATDVNEQPCATCARATTFGNWEWRGLQKED